MDDLSHCIIVVSLLLCKDSSATNNYNVFYLVSGWYRGVSIKKPSVKVSMNTFVNLMGDYIYFAVATQ